MGDPESPEKKYETGSGLGVNYYGGKMQLCTSRMFVDLVEGVNKGITALETRN